MVSILTGVGVIVLFLMFVCVVVYSYIELFKDFNILTLIMVIIMTFLCLFPIAAIYDEVQKESADKVESVVSVKISNKKYHRSKTRLITTGKTTTVIPIAAKYLITITSENHTEELDSEQIYSAFEVGDRFDMILTEYTNKRGTVFKHEFRFIE